MINYKRFDGIDFESHKMQGSAYVGDVEVPCCFTINGLLYPAFFGTICHANNRWFRNAQELFNIDNFRPDMVGIIECFMTLLFSNPALTEDIILEETGKENRVMINFEGIASYIIELGSTTAMVDNKKYGAFTVNIITMAENKGIMADGKLDHMEAFDGQHIYDVYASNTYKLYTFKKTR